MGAPVNAECRKIRAKADEIGGLSAQIIRGIRQLRRLQRVCRKCPDQLNCSILAEANAQIHAALAEIAEEWSIKR